ncbi:MAG: TlpA family protein disulfide reductase [Armatimonadetes bacterium]|nr:TlpA family protein disulfide reductase [Armatimonadota bacterium]
MRKILLLFVLMIPLGATADEDRPAPQPGLQVTAFELFDLQGRLQRMADYSEPVLVLNFFAYWCDTWVAQLPQLRELARQQQDLDFRLIAISVDGQWADARHKYLGDEPPPFPVLLDSRQDLAHRLGLRRVPTVMVLDRERRATTVHEAYPGNPAVLAAIRKALSGK